MLAKPRCPSRFWKLTSDSHVFERYAIYFVPNDIWADLGAEWLGWDNRTAHPSTPYAGEYEGWVKRPRKYGFHATIKAPFRLADGASEDALQSALLTLCADLTPIELASIQLSQIGRFFAFTAPAEQQDLTRLAARAVTDLDTFRAPLTSADLERRRKARLTPEQDALLCRWGYPYVMDQFKFHMTLTGPIRDAAPPQDVLLKHFAQGLQAGLTLDALSLMGERDDGCFQQITRIPLGPQPLL